MRKGTFIGAMVVALAVVVLAGGLLASNMGFKLNYTLSQKGAPTSATGKSMIALPDNRQTGVATSKNLMDDIGFAQTAEITKFLKATDTFQVYSGRKGSAADFALQAGEGYLVRMNTTVNYIVVGSDDPTLAYSLQQKGTGSATGKTLYAYNYHQTAADSKQLMDDIGFAQTAEIAKFLKATDTFQTYSGRKGSGANFTMTPGEAYFIRMNTTVNYTPSHY